MESEPTNAVLTALRQTVDQPTLANARVLEAALRQAGVSAKVFARLNQKSSIDAASESDRGITERIANAFDASLTAARRLSGMHSSDASLTPRPAAQRFLNPDRDSCDWRPVDKDVDFGKPIVQFWPEDENVDLRYRKYKSPEGLVTVLVRDTSLGISRERMSQTILDLNSDDKLKTFEAIGQFGHGGSSALAFCELCLILSQPRFDSGDEEFFWTLIFPEQEGEASKQSLVRKWFADDDGFPLRAPTQAFPSLVGSLPGTSIWHFGYTRGSWLKTAVGTHQDTPAGRFGRLFFSYPLPFEIRGEFARGDTASGMRTVKGAYFRLLEDKNRGDEIVEYRSGEKSETLIVDGETYGQFSVFVFVLRDRGTVRNYVERSHPAVITLNGQNHGEMPSKILTDANLPEVATSAIVEIRLDGLEEEALSNIITNSREYPKTTPFTRALVQRVTSLLEADEALAEIERRRQEEKAKQSSQELNKKITRFLSSILSDAAADPSEKSGGDAPGKRGRKGQPRPEVPAADPPHVLEFVSETPLLVAEGTAKLARFKSDARPPRYSFHGDNPRCFARLELDEAVKDQVTIAGKADVDGRGYGSVTLSCAERPKNPVTEPKTIGVLTLSMQCTDGRLLNAQLQIGVKPKPAERQKKRTQAIQPEIIFCAPEGHDRDALAELLVEEKIVPFGAYLEKYRDALSVQDVHCAYWGEGSERDGVSVLTVEINVAHPQLQDLLRACPTVDERVQAKERVVQDIVLDCYQHCFRLQDLPEIVHEQVVTEPEDLKRAAEICLNYDKALRMAMWRGRALRELGSC
jgi:hypothetical protein